MPIKEDFIREAIVERVIDGDTLEAGIDLGFRVWVKHKIRLEGLNAPEKRTRKGREVALYVEAKVFNQPVMIRSYKTGKYGRWIAEVWYWQGRRLRSLNKELLRKRLAERRKY